MVVGGELVALKKLNGCLVQLKYDYFMQELKALDIPFSVINTVCQLRDARYLSVFAHKESTKVVLPSRIFYSSCLSESRLRIFSCFRLSISFFFSMA